MYTYTLYLRLPIFLKFLVNIVKIINFFNTVPKKSYKSEHFLKNNFNFVPKFKKEVNTK